MYSSMKGKQYQLSLRNKIKDNSLEKRDLMSSRIYRLLFVAIVKADTENEAREKTKKELFSRNITLTFGGFKVEVLKISDTLFECRVFDFYFVETLSFREYMFHLFQKIRTTSLFYIGVVPKVVVIE